MAKSKELTEDEIALFEAVRKGQTDKVIELLKKGTNPNVIDKDGWTPLMTFVAYYENDAKHARLDINIAKELLDFWAETEICADIGGLLHLALRNHDNLELFQLFLEYTTNFDTTDKNGSTPLTTAVNRGNILAVGQLLKAGASPDKGDQDENTPLHEAVRSGFWEIFELLLSKNANINAKNLDGYTVLHTAALYNRSNMMQKLMDRDADPDTCHAQVGSPLHTMVLNLNLPLVKYGLNIGATPFKENMGGETPLQEARRLMAAYHDRPDKVAKLVEIATLLEKFEQLHSLLTATVDTTHPQAHLTPHGKPPVAL